MEYIDDNNTMSIEENFMTIHDSRQENVSHEWIFLNIFVKSVLKRDPSLAPKFLIFMEQFYPYYIFYRYAYAKPLETIILEYSILDYNMKKKNRGLAYDEKDLIKLKKFGSIIMEFLIRYQSYSIIGFSGQKIILTARSNAEKVFDSYLSKGYTLQKMNKIDYHRTFRVSFLEEGYFDILRALPMEDFGYPIDELIETQPHVYVKVLP